MRALLSIFFLLLISAPTCVSQIAITAKPAVFNDWGLNTTSVYGLAPVTSIEKRSYYKIRKPDPATVKIQLFDPVGIITRTVVVTFARGAIAQVTWTDEWGDTYRS